MKVLEAVAMSCSSSSSSVLNDLELVVVPIMPTMPMKVLEAVATSCSSSSSSE
jgi:hypothetical protein